MTWLEGGLGGVLVVCGVRLACCEVFPVIMGDGYSFRDQNLEFFRVSGRYLIFKA